MAAGNIADGVSFAAKTVDYAVFDGSSQAVGEQALQLGLSMTSGRLFREAAFVSRTGWATGAMFRSRETGLAVNNLSGALSTAMTDATRVTYEKAITFSKLIIGQ